jgi:hypothetical protein
MPALMSFVDEHNTQMPHSAFAGQTPDEMLFGTAVDQPAQIAVDMPCVERA